MSIVISINISIYVRLLRLKDISFSLSLFLLANEQTFKSHSNFSFVSSKVFLNDAGSLHRCHGQISHHHPLVKLPHHYERVPGKFQHVTLVIKYFLHHSTDIRVQCLRQFRWPAFPNFRIFLGEVCETLTKKFFFLSIFFYGFLILFFIFLYEIVIFLYYPTHRQASKSCNTFEFYNRRNNPKFHPDTSRQIFSCDIRFSSARFVIFCPTVYCLSFFFPDLSIIFITSR